MRETLETRYAKPPRIRLPFGARRLRVSAILASILVAVLLILVIVWTLVYRSVIAATEGPTEVGSYNARLETSWYGSGRELLKRPAGIAFDRNRGLFFVTDSHRGRIYALDANGNEVTSFGGGTEKDFVLKSPTSVAVATTGQVYVIDAALQKLVIFDRFYKPVRAIRFKEEPPKSVSVLTGADGVEQLWVTSRSGLTRGTLDGDFEKGFYGWGRQEGQFDNPTSLAMLAFGDETVLYVCDSLNYRIQAFDIKNDDLTLRWVYGSPLPMDFQFRYQGENRKFDLPVSIATDDDKQVFVLDGMGAAVVTLDAQTGEQLTAFGEVGTEEGRLLYPAALAYGQGTIWVVDQGNNRVSVFSQSQTSPTARLVRRYMPVWVLWVLAALLGCGEIGCLVWLATIRCTRIVLTVGSIEKIDALQKGPLLADTCKNVSVALGVEPLTRPLWASAFVVVLPPLARIEPVLEPRRGELSSADFDTLAASRSLRKSVLVVDDDGMGAIAAEVGVSTIDTIAFIKEIDRQSGL